MALPSGPVATAVGTILCRIVVPLWVLTGAAIKLWERNPSYLPSTIRDIITSLFATGPDQAAVLETAMRGLIAIELICVGLMVLVPRLSRAVAILILSVFCAVLIGEMARGSGSCGCFGEVPVKPWQMIIADGLLLIGVIVFRPSRANGKPMPALLAGAALWMIASVVIPFAVPEKADVELAAPEDGNGQPDPAPNGGGEVTPPGQSGECPPVPPRPTRARPTYWPIFEELVGQCWSETDLAPLVGPRIEGLDSGTTIIVFYREDCEHCHELFSEHFTGPQPRARTVGIAVPYDNSYAVNPVLPLECTGCELDHRLPIGPSYGITTPVLLVLQDGVVTCYNEQHPEQCLDALQSNGTNGSD